MHQFLVMCIINVLNRKRNTSFRENIAEGREQPMKVGNERKKLEDTLSTRSEGGSSGSLP